jgi:hypothetical protein
MSCPIFSSMSRQALLQAVWPGAKEVHDLAARNALGRDMISVLTIACNELTATQVGERKVLDFLIISLTQHRYHSTSSPQRTERPNNDENCRTKDHERGFLTEYSKSAASPVSSSGSEFFDSMNAARGPRPSRQGRPGSACMPRS